MWFPEGHYTELPVIERISNPQELLAQIIECIHLKDSRGVKTYILEHKLKDETIFWELILKLGNCITSETCENEPGFFDICSRCLLYLTKVGNPKETLLALLEQVDPFIDDVKFKSFLLYIQTALMKIPNKLFHSLDTALESLSSHLTSMPLPGNIVLEGDEIKVFHMDKTVVRLVDVLHAYLTFLEPFVNAVDLYSEKKTEAVKHETLVLRKHIIQVFDHPLCHLILTYNTESDRVKSDSRLCAELAMTLISKLEANFHKLMKNARKMAQDRPIAMGENSGSLVQSTEMKQEEYDNHENERKLSHGNSYKAENITDLIESWDFKLDISPLAQACLAYLLHVEHLGFKKFPCVYRHDYLLEFHLDLISLLLQNTNYPVNYKGLLLCQSLTDLVHPNSISADCLDNPGYMIVLKDLIHIMINCPVRDHRILATKIFPKFIINFEAFGHYKIYLTILSSCDHSGLKGYLITLLKNDLNEVIKLMKANRAQDKSADHHLPGIGIQCKKTAHTPSNYFTGENLHKILKLALALPERETSDMLENSDQIISSLNLLRFLILADPMASNVTGIWDFMPFIDKDFLSPLRLGLGMSKAHYQLELGNIQQGKNSLAAGDRGPEVSVSLGGMNLPAMEKMEKIELLGKAVNTHELMHSLLCRVSELVDQQRNALST